METLSKSVRHFVFRFGGLNGYRWDLRCWTAPYPSNIRNARHDKEHAVIKDDRRRQYVRDMRWVREAVKHGDKRTSPPLFPL